ncbi:MAG: putative nucleotidyltransferase with HDIG domain [Planctomycetota bacterium]|jgi:putative nucleotidyltransferase with HDIG domain
MPVWFDSDSEPPSANAAKSPHSVMSSSNAIRDLISNNLTIPTIPEIVMRINTLLEDPDSGTAEIGAIVAEDAPLAAKVLRVANSAYYGLSGQCVSTAQASTVLGVKVLKNIVTQVAVIKQFDHLDEMGSFDVSALWEHAINTAQVCAFMGRRASKAQDLTPDEYYVCGLLHDIGKIVMLDGLGKKYTTVYDTANHHQLPLHIVEQKQLGFNHTDVGAFVAARWGLPDAVSDAIQFHHGPREEIVKNPVVALVANCNLIVHRVAAGQIAAARAVLDAETTEFLGLRPTQVDEIVQYAADSTQISI